MDNHKGRTFKPIIQTYWFQQRNKSRLEKQNANSKFARIQQNKRNSIWIKDLFASVRFLYHFRVCKNSELSVSLFPLFISVGINIKSEDWKIGLLWKCPCTKKNCNLNVPESWRFLRIEELIGPKTAIAAYPSPYKNILFMKFHTPLWNNGKIIYEIEYKPRNSTPS